MSLPSRISVVIPTYGRETLPRVLHSVVGQLVAGDEVLLLGDTTSGPLPPLVADCVSLFAPWVRVFEHANPNGQHNWGHSQLNAGMPDARGDWIVFNDDDDIFTPDALAAVRAQIAALTEPGPLLFRFTTHYGFTVWSSPGSLQTGHIGGHCLVLPNVPEKFGTWGPHYEGDFQFVYETIQNWVPVEPVWNPHVLQIARPA